jgi:hypothetical protein
MQIEGSISPRSLTSVTMAPAGQFMSIMGLSQGIFRHSASISNVVSRPSVFAGCAQSVGGSDCRDREEIADLLEKIFVDRIFRCQSIASKNGSGIGAQRLFAERASA